MKEDYLFEAVGATENDDKPVRFSELFTPGKDSLIIYSFMFGPDWKEPCTSCTSILDGLNGMIHHAEQRVNVAIVARAPAARIREFAQSRGWRKLRLLSSHDNTYNPDYFAETSPDDQEPICNVFTRRDGRIHHFYATEIMFVPSEPGQDPRHVDAIWPLWHLFDMLPEGRGEDWYPQLSYE